MIRYFLAALMICAGTCHAEEIYLRLKDEAVLDRHQVQLGEIAEVISNDPVKSASLSKLPIVNLETLVKPVRLSKKEIQAILSKDSSAVEDIFVWGGGDSILLTAGTRNIDLSDGMDKSAAWILKNVPWKSDKAEVVTLSKLELEDVPLGKVEQRPSFEDAVWASNKVSMPIKIFVDGYLIAKPVLHFKIQRDLSTSSGLTTSPGNDDVLPISSDNFVSPENKLKSISKSGEPYAVEKDQKVQVVLEVGLMRVESAGIALANGNIGDEVAVQRIDNKETFIGVVSAPSVVTAGDS